ncbi:hypothetical protein [Alicyclobacillus shizuokensis]|uniref:hypothetical protein n=1 Tax=Alicyclobacillus shizuokensis TaxID=392014 RepID=UPI00083670BC|nr:hypothetical protein [Alicyclobacillus shizuokensis]
MPNRIVKESIRTSDTLASISADAERLFWRLVVSADDFGRFDARPNIVLGQCMSAFLGTFTAEQVESWLSELEQAGLIQLYTVEGRRYLVLTKWDKHQRKRAKDSKFPSPDEAYGHPLSHDSERGQLTTNDAPNVNEFENEYENESGSGNENEQTHDTLPPLPDEENLDIEAYTQEVERQMVVCGKTNYIAKKDDAKAIRKLYDSGVPIEFVRKGIAKSFARNPDIGSFQYCYKVIADDWATEMAKRTPQTPIDFVAYRKVAARASPEPVVRVPEPSQERMELMRRQMERARRLADSTDGGGS